MTGNTIRNVAVAGAIAGGSILTGFGAIAIADVAADPAHEQDIADLQHYTSEEGNDARCATTLSLEFQSSLHEATGGKMTDEDAQLFASVLAEKGVEMGGEPIDAQDLKDITAADLSEVPGFDCDEEDGASTHVVIESVKKNAPITIAGLVLTVSGIAYGLGARSGRKSAQKGVK